VTLSHRIVTLPTEIVFLQIASLSLSRKIVKVSRRIASLPESFQH
jgi:hypothetical protein